MKVYGSSLKKILIVFIALILIPGVTYGSIMNRNGMFNLEWFIFGSVFLGGVFGMFVLFFGLGQRVYLTEEEIVYSLNLFSLIFSKHRKRLKLSDIKEIKFGVPKLNQQTTFAAVNIRTSDKEITFAPDLFDGNTLKQLFVDLQNKNREMTLDDYILSAIKGPGESSKVFNTRVFKNFIFTTVFLSLLVVFDIFLYRMGFIQKEVAFPLLAIFLFLSPFIFGRISSVFR